MHWYFGSKNVQVAFASIDFCHVPSPVIARKSASVHYTHHAPSIRIGHRASMTTSPRMHPISTDPGSEVVLSQDSAWMCDHHAHCVGQQRAVKQSPWCTTAIVYAAPPAFTNPHWLAWSMVTWPPPTDHDLHSVGRPSSSRGLTNGSAKVPATTALQVQCGGIALPAVSFRCFCSYYGHCYIALWV